jgi:hypothetical protein
LHPLVIFIYERRVRQEDLGLVECTEDFEVEEMRELLGDLERQPLTKCSAAVEGGESPLNQGLDKLECGRSVL